METQREVHANGIRLAYTVDGHANADPVVLLHALGERGADWAPVVERLSDRFRIVSMDLRGHGVSDWPGSYSLRLMCDDVVAALDRLELRGVVLVGHSMGGAVAYLIAIRRPDLVSHLVVEDAVPPFRRDRPVPEKPQGEVAFDWRAVPAIVGEVNAGDQATWDALATITAPTLLVGGGPQSHIPQAELAAAAALIPTSELVTIPAGHLVHAARPAEFTDVVLGWLDGIPARQSPDA